MRIVDVQNMTDSGISDLLECSICSEQLVDPKALPCIHTFCSKCLQEYTKNLTPGQMGSCPLCRQAFYLPWGGVQALPSNHIMNNLISITKVDNSKITCQSCVKTAAAHYCVHCKQHICQNCSDNHKRVDALVLHKQVSMDDKDAYSLAVNSNIMYCYSHYGKELDLFCIDCQYLICTRCLATGHADHRFMGIEDWTKDLNSLLEGNLEAIKGSQASRTAEMDQIVHNKLEFTISVNKARDELAKKCDQMVAVVNAYKQKCLEKLSREKEEGLVKWTTTESEIQEKIANLARYEKHCSDTMNNGTPYDILARFNDLSTDGLKLLQDAELSIATPEIKTFKYDAGGFDVHKIKDYVGSVSVHVQPAKPRELPQAAPLKAISQSKTETLHPFNPGEALNLQKDFEDQSCAEFLSSLFSSGSAEPTGPDSSLAPPPGSLNPILATPTNDALLESPPSPALTEIQDIHDYLLRPIPFATVNQKIQNDYDKLVGSKRKRIEKPTADSSPRAKKAPALHKPIPKLGYDVISLID